MKSRSIISGALLLALLTSSCALERTTVDIPEYTIRGTATAGPVCPVESDPPDPACADRPVAAAVLFILKEDGSRFSEVTTDADGQFEVRIPAGNYTLEPQPVEGLMGTAPPQDFAAGPALTVDLDLSYDTGIR